MGNSNNSKTYHPKRIATFKAYGYCYSCFKTSDPAYEKKYYAIKTFHWTHPQISRFHDIDSMKKFIKYDMIKGDIGLRYDLTFSK